jgi:hypothetical protein
MRSTILWIPFVSISDLEKKMRWHSPTVNTGRRAGLAFSRGGGIVPRFFPAERVS